MLFWNRKSNPRSHIECAAHNSINSAFFAGAVAHEKDLVCRAGEIHRILCPWLKAGPDHYAVCPNGLFSAIFIRIDYFSSGNALDHGLQKKIEVGMASIYPRLGGYIVGAYISRVYHIRPG